MKDTAYSAHAGFRSISQSPSWRVSCQAEDWSPLFFVNAFLGRRFYQEIDPPRRPAFFLPAFPRGCSLIFRPSFRIGPCTSADFISRFQTYEESPSHLPLLERRLVEGTLPPQREFPFRRSFLGYGDSLSLTVSP